MVYCKNHISLIHELSLRRHGATIPENNTPIHEKVEERGSVSSSHRDVSYTGGWREGKEAADRVTSTNPAQEKVYVKRDGGKDADRDGRREAGGGEGSRPVRDS
ncbi:hypothetical protein E2C01_047213 [Portunus trituberculatus]|uniref:Uncharacterized protein n=1 Tax=Portunus trituberculatus TaxID=210409 RepID=A0A5B7G9V2_PORTR|nr:hypothetical protein [Portunus trituberculatus]